MLRESYKRKIKEIREVNPKMKVIDVTPTSNSPLSPSPELMSDFRSNRITWDEFKERFIKEMNTPTIEATLLDIARQAVNEDIYLICYEARGHCHRTILLDLIEELAVKNKIPVKIEKTKHVIE
jgi:uncharacterized protein YeaO (DUF488 family)